MAKVKLSALVSDIRGAVGGTTFLKGRGGAVVRINVMPTKKYSGNRSFFRSLYASLATKWRGLTVAQQTAWNAAAASWPVTDVYGVPLVGTGLNLYIKLNMVRFPFSVTYITLPPNPMQFCVLSGVSFVFNTGASSLVGTVTTFGSTANQAIYYTASRPVGLGLAAGSVKYCLLTIVNAAVGTGNLYTLYTTRYGVPPVGSRVWFRFHLMNTATGQKTTDVYSSCIVT